MQESYQPFNKKKEGQHIDRARPFSEKEIFIIIIALFCALLIFLFPTLNMLQTLIGLITMIIIIPLTLFVKKIAGVEHAMQIEHSFWIMSRFGFKTKARTKKPLPMGIILPLVITIISLGYIKPLTFFQFDAENMRWRRILKAKGYRRGLRKELMNESDFAFTASYSMYAILAYAVIMYLLALFTEFSFFVDSGYYALAYGAWNLIPVSQLDGAKIFFGSFITWAILVFLFAILFALVGFF